MDKAGHEAEGESARTHSGTPNPIDAGNGESSQHKSGYGGEGGAPRPSSDSEKGED